MPLLLGEFIESRGLRGAIMGLDNALALLLIPVIGTWSDRVNTPLGSRLPFIVVALPLAAVFLALLPVAGTTLSLLIAADIVFLLAMTVLRAPIISLMPDHVAPPRRSAANGLINLMGGIGGLMAFFVLAPLWDLNQIYPFLLGGAILLLVLPILVLAVDRRPPFAEPVTAQEATPLGSLLSGVRSLLEPQHRRALALLSAIALYTIGFAAVEAQFTVYATESLGITGGTAGLLLGVFSLAFVIAAVPAGYVGSRLGKSRAMQLGLLGMPLGLLGAAFSASVVPLGISLAFAGFGWALINVQAYPWVADLGGTERIGFFTGLYYLFTMSASVVAPTFAGTLMDLFGDVSLFALVIGALLTGFLLLPKRDEAPPAQAG